METQVYTATAPDTQRWYALVLFVISAIGGSLVV